MQIKDIISVLPRIAAEKNIQPGREISGIAYDSRRVEPGFVFFAIPGAAEDGHAFAPQAVENGALLVVAQRELNLPADISQIIVEDSRRALAGLAAAWYGHPDRGLRLIGVTGTNGKTTTTHLIKYLLGRGGSRTGLVGTVANLAGDKVLPATHTTPESLELFRLLRLMRDEGCGHAVIEASSHALAQGRVSACNFVGAVFTNLTQDHLDYHGTLEEYGRSKARLFAMLQAGDASSYGVINADDKAAAIFAEACAAPLWTYGMEEGSTLRLLHYSASISGMKFTLTYEGEVYTISMPLIGKFNIYNALAAAAVALAEGLSLPDIAAWLAQAPQVAGRFELIDEGQDYAVVVDYAHTPDGLENLLAAARELKPRQLITVFGCGGNRDNGKRPIMGRIAGQYSDVSIITSDNPRFEDPMRIIDMVERGIKEVGNNYLVEADRARAVKLAINMAEHGDMVVLAGKGHEDYQIVLDAKHHLDDRELAREAIRARRGG